MRHLLVLVFNIIVATIVSARYDLYVTPIGGNDTDTCGSLATPCSTLQYTVSHRASSNSTVLALPGVHTSAGGDSIDLSGSNLTVMLVQHCTDFNGGGIRIDASASPLLVNVTVRNNTAARRGRVVHYGQWYQP